MNHTTLANKPELIDKAQKLIEKSFEYSSDNKFTTDFYPLFNKNNFHNCHILERDGKVLAHIGLKRRKIAEFPITMYGGIAVDKDVRGQGLFKNLFNTLVTKETDCLFHILWSNKLDLYKTHNFHPAITLNEYSHKKRKHFFEIEEITWSNFNLEYLYENSQEVRVKRSKSHWEDIKSIESAQIYLIKKNKKVLNYFIKGKGADLINIIHEYGTMNNEYLACMRNYGKVWTPYQTQEAIKIYSAILRLGNEDILKEFSRNYFNLEINEVVENNIIFTFEDKRINLTHHEFLIGILGPTPFEEFQKKKPFFISGLDSI